MNHNICQQTVIGLGIGQWSAILFRRPETGRHTGTHVYSFYGPSNGLIKRNTIYLLLLPRELVEIAGTAAASQCVPSVVVNICRQSSLVSLCCAPFLPYIDQLQSFWIITGMGLSFANHNSLFVPVISLETFRSDLCRGRGPPRLTLSVVCERFTS